MELIVKEMQLPSVIEFNFEELKGEIAELLSYYDGLVYTADQVKDAKSDRAKLNKLKKALNDERIRREREYMKPFADFKAKVNEIIAMIDEPVALIDEQVKCFEEKQKKEKEALIVDFWEGILFADDDPASFVELEQLWNEKWLNASASLQSVIEEIESKLQRIRIDVATLDSLPEFGFEARKIYEQTLDIAQAIAKGKEIAEMQKEKEQAKAVEVVVPVVEEEHEEGFLPSFDSTESIWRTYRIKLTTDQKQILEQFLITSGIMFQEGGNE